MQLRSENNRIYYFMTAMFCVLFIILSIARYFNIHSTYFDLGIYENIIYRVAFQHEWSLLFSGHVYPILFIHSFIYRIFPFTETLLILQALIVSIGSYPLYLLAKKKLKGIYPLIVIISYFVYYGVEYNIIFDFHPDHIIIPVLLYAFYFLDENKLSQFIITCLIGMTVKEPFNLVIMMLGLYALVKYRHMKSGIFVAVAGLTMFIIDVKVIIPFVSPWIASVQKLQAAKFGASVPEMIVNLFVNPRIWMHLIFNKDVITFICFVFIPLMFIPFLAPLELVIALPIFLILFSTGSSLHVGIANHYLACIIPPLFVAFVYGLKKVEKFKSIGIIILGVGLLSNIVLSPSPISYTFWSGRALNFSYKVYLPENRNNMIKDNVQKYIPANPGISVASQNSFNYGYLAKRDKYKPFPDDFMNVDYIVIDLKRPLYVLDRIDKEKFMEKFDFARKKRKLIYEYDGFYILGEKIIQPE